MSVLRERIAGFAASRLSRDAAEDIAQEVLMVIEQKYAHLDRIEDLLPLSLQIVRFKIMGARRKMSRRGEYATISTDEIQLRDPRADPEHLARQRIMIDRLRKAIAKLGDRCRELLKYKLQGRTFVEIQKLMAAGSINTVYTWDLRCRKSLMETMGGDWERE